MGARETALIVGAGSGLSASLARLLAKQGMGVALAARNTDKLAGLAAETEAVTVSCDAQEADQVAAMFAELDKDFGTPNLVIYNPSARARGPITDLEPDGVKATLMASFGAFLVAQQAARRMVARGSGSIQFTGASASIKGYPQSAPFAMGKFAVRGLAQSMARELAPQNIHVAHFVIDGGIAAPGREGSDDNMLAPDAIAESYLHVHRQHRSAWTWEVELRPWVEKF